MTKDKQISSMIRRVVAVVVVRWRERRLSKFVNSLPTKVRESREQAVRLLANSD